jgi:mRNA-degrading endonuclease RelE of RelBE toxin-antitoxin system
MMKIYLTKTLKRSISKLHQNQKAEIEKAIKTIKNDLQIGELKTADLKGVRVYKFHVQNQLMLLAYLHDEINHSLTFLAFGSHENFYRDLKKQIL